MEKMLENYAIPFWFADTYIGSKERCISSSYFQNWHLEQYAADVNADYWQSLALQD